MLSGDEAIQNTVAMLPPSPGNTLLDFLNGVVAGELQPAMCQDEVRIDAQRYWEVRRVQNSVRRVVEGLTEMVLGVDAEVASIDLGGALWDFLFTGYRSVDEGTFIAALEAVEAWPPEMSPADRNEVFAALRVPSGAAVRGLTTGLPLPAQLSRRMLSEAFSRLPFNIPDFPVPLHLYRPDVANLEVYEVADAVAAVFCKESTGLERAKDYFLCGLLSMEQIQVALSCIVKDSLVELAVIQIIRAGTERFTAREWQTLVWSARCVPPPQQAAAPGSLEQDLEEQHQLLQQQQEQQQQQLQQQQQQQQLQLQQQLLQQQQQLLQQQQQQQQLQLQQVRPPAIPPTPPRDVHREVLSYISPPLPYREVAAVASPLGAADPVAEEASEQRRPRRQTAPSSSPVPAGQAAAMTEPVPHRGVRPFEEPMKFQPQVLNGPLRHLIDWKTTRLRAEAAAETAPGAPPDVVGGSSPAVGSTADADSLLVGSSGAAGSSLVGGGVGALDPGHGADEGAGTRADFALQEPTGQAGHDGDRMDDPIRFISLDMHNECLGPFLAHAFVRCCQLYEEGRLSDFRIS